MSGSDRQLIAVFRRSGMGEFRTDRSGAYACTSQTFSYLQSQNLANVLES